MSFDVQDYKDAMSRFPSGVTIVTSRLNGENYGMTVSSFVSVSLDPPMVLICVDRRFRLREAIESSRVFAVNILSEDQKGLGQTFANGNLSMGERFKDLDILDQQSGAPIIRACQSYLDCTLHDSYSAGDHTIYFGKVELCGTNPQKPPLLYHNRNWHSLKKL